MQSTIVIFVVCFWSLCCAQHCPQYAETPEFTDTGAAHCSTKTHMKHLSDVTIKNMCGKPKDVIIDILSEDKSYTYLPSKVTVKRCAGHCMSGMTCIPRKKKMTPIAVRRNERNTGYVTCGYVQIEEHISCKCGCTVMPGDCNDLQEYSASDCQCNCINGRKPEDCVKPKDMWNMDKCECE
ncbi:uncharacterized protein LOC126251550 [Schistocerca nitens]|uniref:uncharacterized protein LOC126251550 n=1 Tax=Schistocerca nitens TaxID=7011 RepID=UPI0021198D41|nr:uncharacterized protein LOC126251550 [Schistocerca nitens]